MSHISRYRVVDGTLPRASLRRRS